MKRIEKEIQDNQIADICHKCCLVCKKYKTVKEQKEKCEVQRARTRIIKRETYRATKKEKV